ncbi:major facilitator superfamily protein, putative [Ichthyophthirius multifiliis]|uniref:UNC93-like protein MFSD11 n=1 Tax=Ichthyophthirius multifiliis TaxID=5932 RepID=G0QVM5_ICHMU|nr:major facilitator superfamily protein, putative [Ichthyophthirius multifiliis]EGR30712.1 major facilitator superfamily protein, putative [Ichthyophthirius multifiliis]|eukprot:XP_004032299.1 major facilitator superfamily protein, putative [Ichthyophthirius multifiliis]
MGALFNVIYSNLVFMLYVSSANAGLGIISQIFDQKEYLNLGNTSLFIIYFISMINSILAPMYIKKLSWNYVFTLGSLGYIFFLCQGILVCSCKTKTQYFYCSTPIMYVIIVIGSTICGLLASILYLAQNQYLSENTQDNNKSLYFGIGWSLLQSSYIIGNIYSAFLIQPLGQYNYFILMTAVSGVSAIFFIFIKSPPIQKLKVQIKSMIQLIKTKQIRPLLFYMFSSGIILSLEWEF